MDQAELAGLVAGIGLPNTATAEAARARQTRLTKPTGALGRLEELSVWVAAAQGACPPRNFERARVVVFAGDHGIARAGVSAYPPEVTGQMVANFLAGGAAVNVLARLAGATVRVVDMAVDADTPEQVRGYKICRSSGRIDQQDALTREQAGAALLAGTRIADEEVDAGADLLVPGDMGIGNTTPCAVLVAALTGVEPARVTGRGTGVDDAGWMRKVAAVRDALRRARPYLPGRSDGGAALDPVGLLAAVGGADLAAMTGFLLQAAARRTPVLLDGLVSGTAALLAYRIAPDAVHWWLAAHRSTEPAHSVLLDRLGLVPIVDLEMRLGEGSGALLALPVLRAAVATLAEMATFDQAGVSDRAAD